MGVLYKRFKGWFFRSIYLLYKENKEPNRYYRLIAGCIYLAVLNYTYGTIYVKLMVFVMMLCYCKIYKEQ